MTSLQLLDDEEIPGRHIIRISGHKSESTINTYARKLSSAMKRSISDVFHKATGILQESNKATIQKNETQNLPAPSAHNILPSSQAINFNIIDMEENDEFLSDSQMERFILLIHTLNIYPSYILAWQHHPLCSLSWKLLNYWYARSSKFRFQQL